MPDPALPGQHPEPSLFETLTRHGPAVHGPGMENDNTFGSSLLRAWMQAEGLRQRDAAARLGCSRASLSMWLAGTRPGLLWALAIQRAAGIPLHAWLLEGERKVLERVRKP